MLSSTFNDEMGYLPLDELGATIFFQLVSARYERGSIILTSNKSYGDWGGIFGDPKVRIVTLKRRSKKHRVDAVAASRSGGTTAKSGRCVTCPAGTCEYCLNWRCGALIAVAAAR